MDYQAKSQQLQPVSKWLALKGMLRCLYERYYRYYPLITLRFVFAVIFVLIWVIWTFDALRNASEPGRIFLAGAVLDPGYSVPEGRKPSELSFLSTEETVQQFKSDLFDTTNKPFQYIFTNLPSTVQTNLLQISNIVAFKTNLVSGLEQMLTNLSATALPGIRQRDKTKELAGKARTPAERAWLGMLTLEDIWRNAHPHHFRHEDLAPRAIVLLFGVILALLAWRIFVIVRDTYYVAKFESGAHGWKKLEQLRQHCKQGCAKRRVQFLSAPKREENLEDTLPAISALDASSIGEGYTAIKICIWILPVIGFVGTAMGMSEAINGFKQALGSDVDRLTSTLASVVIPGLASAFYTTIMALLAAVFGHFSATIFEESEHTVLGRLDRASLNFVEGRPNTHGIGDVTGTTEYERLATSNQLDELKARLLENIEHIEAIQKQRPVPGENMRDS